MLILGGLIHKFYLGFYVFFITERKDTTSRRHGQLYIIICQDMVRLGALTETTKG